MLTKHALASASLVLAFMAAAASSAATPPGDVTSMSRDEAKAIIRQIFEEQPEKLRPVLVEIGDDAVRLGFSTLRRNNWTGNMATIERRESYYFANLAQLELVKSRGRVLVNLSNREGSVRRWVYVYEQAKGENFIAAMNRLANPE
jgi:hypothetical protein